MTGEARLDALAMQLAGYRVLVTGGTGFVGRRLLQRLEATGIRLTGVTRRAAPLAGTGVTWRQLDLRDSESVRTLVREVQPEIVFHLAAKLGADRSLACADAMLFDNVVATHNLLVSLGEECSSLHRLVLMGSSEEYGNQDVVPYTEEMTPRPVSPYSASKAAATQFALLYHRLFHLPVVVLRPFIIYGPGQTRGMLIPSLVHAVRAGADFPMTAGEQTRDFVYVDDVIDCILAAAVHPQAIGEVFNVCSGVEHSIRDVAELTVKLAGATMRLLTGAIPYRDNEVWRLAGSNDKAARLLGWSPGTSLEHGLRDTLDYTT